MKGDVSTTKSVVSRRTFMTFKKLLVFSSTEYNINDYLTFESCRNSCTLYVCDVNNRDRFFYEQAVKLAYDNFTLSPCLYKLLP